jgi:hypothetical protein
VQCERLRCSDYRSKVLDVKRIRVALSPTVHSLATLANRNAESLGGMHLEFCYPEYSTRMVTSRMQEIRECSGCGPVLDQAAQHMVEHKAVR